MDSDRVEAVAQAIVASDFAESSHLGELTDERWQEMINHWRSLESEPELRSGHRVDDAMRRARAALAAAAPPGDAVERAGRAAWEHRRGLVVGARSWDEEDAQIKREFCEMMRAALVAAGPWQGWLTDD